jgi:hypothetical protein
MGTVALLVGLLLAGCGSSTIKQKGRIVKGGQPFQTDEGSGLRLFFEPIEPSGTTYDAFVAEYNRDDGTFVVKGKDGKGLPPGKYRITLQMMKNKEDEFKGRYFGKKTPFTAEVTDGSEEIVVDLDQASAPAKP